MQETLPAPVTAPPVPATAVLVLGMHRSGTSALARALNLMGVDLGDDLLRPRPTTNRVFGNTGPSSSSTTGL